MPRAKQFDEESALSDAMHAFWARGFEATSMQELVDVMGINRASIYATFGDKQTLFIRALKRYDRVFRAAWLSGLADAHDPRGAILQAFKDAIEAALNGGTDGCFLVNTALEIAPHDDEVRELVAGALRSAEHFFEVMLEAGGRDAALAPALLSLFLGVRVLARCRPEPELMKGIYAQVETMIV